MIRFDAKALYKALDTQRLERGLKWKDVEAETGIAKSTIMRTRDGGRMEVDGCWQWLRGWEFQLKLLKDTSR